jgi:hypothetical protein
LAGLGISAAAGSSSSSTSSSSVSPYAADISSQLGGSSARPNQVQAFEQLKAYFGDLSTDRPAPAQLAAAMQATHDAMCSLREGVCKLLLSGNMVRVSRRFMLGRARCWQHVKLRSWPCKKARHCSLRKRRDTRAIWHQIGLCICSCVE